MTEIGPNLLNDTLNLVALARETALARGDQARAGKLAPVVDDLRGLVTWAQETSSPAARSPDQRPVGFLAQDDFQTLLRVVQSGGASSADGTSGAATPLERNQMVAAMSAGGMPDVDIARQLGITREEVRLVLTLSRPSPGADPATYLKPPAGRDGEMGQAPGLQRPGVACRTYL